MAELRHQKVKETGYEGVKWTALAQDNAITEDTEINIQEISSTAEETVNL
jgi:hypothetical protein